MVKENELRIGNWVMCEDGQTESLTNRFVKVKTLAGKYIHWESPFTIIGSGRCVGGTKYADADPIPLTPEILEKAGFTESLNSEYGGWLSPFSDDSAIRVRINGNGVFYYQTDKYANPIYITSMHQLQNLYFALTGEELEITL